MASDGGFDSIYLIAVPPCSSLRMWTPLSSTCRRRLGNPGKFTRFVDPDFHDLVPAPMVPKVGTHFRRMGTVGFKAAHVG